MSEAVLHHVALACADPAAVENFYTRHFGFTRARVIVAGDTEIVFLKSGDAYLELFPAEGTSGDAAPTEDGQHFPGVRHLAFKVADVEAKLAEMGDDAKITHGPFDFGEVIPGWRTVWVADPDGRIVEISQGYVDQTNPPSRG